jgi:soluble lytic murein transglycosylase-like protein
LCALGLLALLTNPCSADIYAYVDSKGVRHISNVPNDARYRLVKRTPKYKKPAKSSKTELGSFDADQTQQGGWQLITPMGKEGSQDIFSGKNPQRFYMGNVGLRHINWSQRAASKPFRINEANRKRFTPYISSIAGKHRLDPALLHAVISAESGFNPKAVSRAGARGLMQLMPATAERFGVGNSFDPVANMRGGAKYLRWLLDRFKNLNLAIAAYNAGEGAVEKYGNKIPPYEETQTYVARVLQFYNHYRRVN